MEAALQPRPTRDAAGVLLVAVVTMFALHAIPYARASLMQNEDDGWTMRKKGLPGWVSRREVADQQPGGGSEFDADLYDDTYHYDEIFFEYIISMT
jgi:hypothetical protein